MEDYDYEAMADATDLKRKHAKENPGPIVRVEYLTAGTLHDAAENAVVTEWLNGLALSSRVTLAARLLNFTREDMRPDTPEAQRIADRIEAAAQECALLSTRLAMYGRTTEIVSEGRA